MSITLTEEKKYPLPTNPVFWTIQGEKHLRGFQMCFVRLGGCSVGCANCDTDYAVKTRATAEEIAEMADAVTPKDCSDKWVWVTGGEPTDHDLRPLLSALHARRFSTCVATAGHRRMIPPVDWLSVSPHNPEQWQQMYGNEVCIVPGLNGFSIDDFVSARPGDQMRFMYQYVQPLWDMKKDDEDKESLKECLLFLKHHPNWALSRQDHKYWGMA